MRGRGCKAAKAAATDASPPAAGPPQLRGGANRDSWQKPHEVVQALKLRNGEVVADMGAGTGYFARRFAKAVAPDGKVYAVDTDAEALGYLRERADAEGLPAVIIIVSREDDPLLPPDSIDLAFFADTTHHVANRIRFYRRMLPALKDNARLVIIDYPPGGPHAPHPPEQIVPAPRPSRKRSRPGSSRRGVPVPALSIPSRVRAALNGGCHDQALEEGPPRPFASPA